ncbi:MAG: outer membrane protein assembly factor BamA [Nitrospiraceae bacterium]|nr:MAG: outer membrane protein assembly factor BamA [Nitrospiraceae bacterium]
MTYIMKSGKCPFAEGRLFIFILIFYFCFSLPANAEMVTPANHNRSAEMEKQEGPVPEITAVDVKGLTRMETEELIDLIGLSIGDRLDREELGRGIRRAFLKEFFQDIKAVTEPYGDGVRLIFIADEIPRIDRIIIKGVRNINEKIIRGKFHFREGEDFKEEYLDSAGLALKGFISRKGYPDASVRISAENTDRKSWVNLRVNIDEGQPLIVRRIDTEDDVRHLIGLGKGDVLDTVELDKDLKKITEYYKKKNYIKTVAGPYTFTNGTLEVPVDPGLRYEVKFRNNSVLKSAKLEKELAFIENEEISDEAIAESADRIKRYYVSNGYYSAQVAAGVERDDDVIRITFIVFEGEITALRNISFSGTTINPEGIRRILPFEEGKPFNNNLLEDSTESIIRFYNALGYLHADVTEVKKDFQNNRRDLNLEYVIKEGEQTIIRTINIAGNRQLDSHQVRNAMNLKEGVPYNVIDMGDARRRVLTLYSRYGYLDAGVDVESRIDGENALLTYNITENRPSFIGKIILKGNQKTKAKIIMRELTMKEGEAYNLEEISRTKQRLYKLGIFSEVAIDVLDGGIETDNRTIKDLLISVKEGKSGSVEVSLGYGDYEQVRGTLEISYRNIGGYNRNAGFRTDQNAVERRYIFNFREPWLFNWPDVPLKIFLIREERRGLNIESRDVLYKIDKQSFIAGIEKEIAEGLKIGLDYEYSFTDTKDVEEDVILSKEDSGTLGISSISPSIYFDKRNDPFNPTSGSLHGIVVKYAPKALLSESEFVKGTVQSSWYVQLAKPVVLAFSVRGGMAYGFGDNEELPLIERFFLGGRSTVRGYSHDDLGPKGSDDNPTGGNIFALTNWELRFALGKGFGLVTFVDAGNVWKTIDDVQDELKYTAGAGLRYNTPVGPIRIDYGHKMNKDEGDSSGEVHFNFGHAF